VTGLAAARGVSPDVLAQTMHRDGIVARRRIAIGRPLGTAGDRYVEGMRSVYEALAAGSGTSTIIDTSKDPAQAMLARRTGLPVTVVHLVRDPRAVAWSHQRTKRPPAGAAAGATPRRRTGYVTTRWLVRNLFLETRGHVDLRLRYEDLVAQPSAVVDRVMGRDMVDEPHPHLHHVIAGNPNRFDTGPLVVRPDTDWVRVQPRPQRATASVVALPLLRRYGYRVIS